MKFVEPIGPNRKFGAMGHPSRGTDKDRILGLHLDRGRAYSFFGFAARERHNIGRGFAPSCSTQGRDAATGDLSPMIRIAAIGIPSP
jgi:hypothetical protein